MGLFMPQPSYCNICGSKDDRLYDSVSGVNMAIVCSDECRGEWNRRFALCAMGKQFYPAAPKGGAHE